MLSPTSTSSAATPLASSFVGMESDSVNGFKQQLAALQSSTSILEQRCQNLHQVFREATEYFEAQIASRAQLTTMASKQQRNANLLGCATFFFQAATLSQTWLDEDGHEMGDILLKLIRRVPVSLSELVRQACKTRDARFRAQCFELFASHSALARQGRLIADVPTMNHTLDLMYHLHKLKSHLETTNGGGGDGGEDATFETDFNAWLTEFTGGPIHEEASKSVHTSFFASSTAQEFKERTAAMIQLCKFDKDSDGAMDLALVSASVAIGMDAAPTAFHAMQGFGPHFGIGRFGCSVYFAFPAQFLLDLSFWNVSRTVVTETSADERAFQIEFAAKVDLDANYTIRKAVGEEHLPDGGNEEREYVLRFCVSGTMSKDELQNTLDRRRFRFLRAGNEHKTQRQPRVSRVSRPLLNTSGKAQPPVMMHKAASPLVFRNHRKEEIAQGESPKPVVTVTPANAAAMLPVEEMPNSDITDVEDISSQHDQRQQKAAAAAAASTASMSRQAPLKQLPRNLPASKRGAAAVASKQLQLNQQQNKATSPTDVSKMTIPDLFVLAKNYHAHLVPEFFSAGGKLKSGRNKRELQEALREDEASRAAKPIGRKRLVESEDEDGGEEEEEEAPPRRTRKRTQLAEELALVMESETSPVVEAVSAGVLPSATASMEIDFSLPPPPQQQQQREESTLPSESEEFDFVATTSKSSSATRSAAAKKKKQPQQQRAKPPATKSAPLRKHVEEANTPVPASNFEEEEPVIAKAQQVLQESSLPDPPMSSSPRTLPAASPNAVEATGGMTTSATTPTSATQKTIVFPESNRGEENEEEEVEAMTTTAASLRPRTLDFQANLLATDQVSPPSATVASAVSAASAHTVFAAPPSPVQFALPHSPQAFSPVPSSPVATAQAAPLARRSAVPRLAQIIIPPHQHQQLPPSRQPPPPAKRVKPLSADEHQAGPVQNDESSSDNDQDDDFETEEIQNDAVLECGRAMVSIRRAIQKVASRRNRVAKKNDKLLRATMHQGQQVIAHIHAAEQTFLQAFERYEDLLVQRDQRAQARAQAVQHRVQFLAQLKRDADRVQRDVARHNQELAQHMQQFGAALQASSKKQLGEIQRLLVRQKKEAKEWKPTALGSVAGGRA